MSSLQKLTAKNAKDAKVFIKYCSAYSAVSAMRNLFAVESFINIALRTLRSLR